MKRFLALLLFFCAAGVSLADDPSVSACRVTITTPGPQTGYYTVSGGSGTVVQAGENHSLVLTNWHVIPNGYGDIHVYMPSGKAYDAEYLVSDDIADLTLLVVMEKLPAVRLATEEPKLNTVLRQWGYPHGARTFKSGPALGNIGGAHVKYKLASGRELDGGPVYFAQMAPIPGDSGAGLFNDKDELVAVNWGGGGTPRECCVALENIRRFLVRERNFVPNLPRPPAKSVVTPPSVKAPAQFPQAWYPPTYQTQYCPPGQP